ncbi:hypothetical protein [Singulisphaera sp. GP187]|uniref:hypothetical protein n=1 Tax=Singulisphaera sp. GP187 TaxID=1882752 RepID=UPI00135648DF|nr:hypothetical protein [Singulisphaera sp. GP187]
MEPEKLSVSTVGRMVGKSNRFTALARTVVLRASVRRTSVSVTEARCPDGWWLQ